MIFFKKKTPKHDCRDSVASPLDYPDGSMLICPSCCSLLVKYIYFDDDLWGGTGEYHSWRKATIDEYGPMIESYKS